MPVYYVEKLLGGSCDVARRQSWPLGHIVAWAVGSFVPFGSDKPFYVNF